nr:heparin lyase I family protein [Bacteroidota bacterium]
MKNLTQKLKKVQLILIGFLVLFLKSNCLMAQVSYSSGWETGITGNGNWGITQMVASDRIQRVTSPVRKGQYAARVQVGPGDDPINSSGERSEVSGMKASNGNSIEENESSGTQYHAFSIRLDPTWKSISGWAIVFQLHGGLGTSPAFAVDIANNAFNIAMNSGDIETPSKYYNYKHHQFSDASLNIG